jgi:hypothetical protein
MCLSVYLAVYNMPCKLWQDPTKIWSAGSVPKGGECGRADVRGPQLAALGGSCCTSCGLGSWLCWGLTCLFDPLTRSLNGRRVANAVAASSASSAVSQTASAQARQAPPASPIGQLRLQALVLAYWDRLQRPGCAAAGSYTAALQCS